jgi:ribose transport system substrate-binding protein
MVKPLDPPNGPFTTWYSFSVQTPPNYGQSTMETFEKWLAGEEVPAQVALPKETFNNNTPEQLERAQERIEELEELGVGCC